MEFSRKEWSGLPFPFPGDLPDVGMEPQSPALQANSLPSAPPGKPEVPLRMASSTAALGGGAGGMLPRDRWNEIQSVSRLEVSLLPRSAWQRVALSEVSVPRGGAPPSPRGPPAQGWQVNQGPRDRPRAVFCLQSPRPGLQAEANLSLIPASSN